MDAVGTGDVSFHTSHPNLVCLEEILVLFGQLRQGFCNALYET